jgi:hypothetical protein
MKIDIGEHQPTISPPADYSGGLIVYLLNSLTNSQQCYLIVIVTAFTTPGSFTHPTLTTPRIELRTSHWRSYTCLHRLQAGVNTATYMGCYLAGSSF